MISGQLYRPFRPKRGPVVAVASAIFLIVGYLILLATVRGHPDYGGWDRWGMGVIVAIGVWFLSTQARVVAIPDERGLSIRNLVVRHHVEWAQIISVRFGAGRPWARLDISDGTTVAVMAIQASDGPRGLREAQRLATLVQLHEIGDVDPPVSLC
ncbi:MAG: PH domain-containing protein [Bowdeniella nasicola]|nr:PH domain-containing protein [Bowdeniella nasicola]